MSVNRDYLPYVDRIAALPLPKCVMTFGGITLETQIPGYRTLYVSGRDSLSAEMNEIDGIITDGSFHRWRHIGPRDIQVGYAVVCDTPEQYHKAMNKLKGILFAKGAENVKIIFGDEPDVYFVGHVTEMPADKVADARSGGGALTIHCPKPWKYSVTEYEKAPIGVTGGSGTIELDYGGTYPAFPTFEVTANSNIGYVSFIKTTATGITGQETVPSKVIQFGDPEESGTTPAQVETSFDDKFGTARPSGWNNNNPYTPSNRNVHEHKGTLYINGAGIGCYEHADGYSTGTQWHGPTITKTISSATKNFQCYFHNLITTGSVGECGCFVLSIDAGSGSSRSNIAAMWFVKSSPSNNSGRIELVVKDSIKQTITIPSLTYNNTLTGYPKGSAWYDVANIPEANRSQNTAGGAFYITKLGNKIQFTVAGTIYEFTESSLENTEATEVSAWFEKWGAETPPITVMILHQVRFVKVLGNSIPATTTVDEIVNKFLSGDNIVADVNSASITVNGTPKYGIGAMGNDWEEFTLDPGANIISCNYSDWATAPTFKMKYREVYL